MSIIKTAIFLLLLPPIAMASPGRDESAVYDDTGGVYVSPTGSDTTGNGAFDNPYKTIQYVIDGMEDSSISGDLILLLDGSYAEEVRVDSDITIRSANGNWGIIDNPYDDSGVAISVYIYFHASGVTLENIEIRGGYYYGIKLETNYGWGIENEYGVSNVTIKNCIITDSGRDAIKITPLVHDVLIENNVISDTGLRDSSNADGIDCVNAHNVTVRGNHIYNAATSGLYLKGGSADGVIEGNLIENTGSMGIGLGFDTSPEWFTDDNYYKYENVRGIVRNNVVIGAAWSGIGIYAAKDGKVYNNTIVNCSDTYHSPIYFGLTYQDWSTGSPPYRPPSDNVEIRNNIVYQGAGHGNSADCFYMRYSSDLGGMLPYTDGEFPTMSNNIYYREDGACDFQDRRPNSPLYSGNGLAAWQIHSSSDANSVETDPNLDSVTGWRLQATSTAAIGAGISLPLDVVYDIDGQTRGAAFDIGADQYAAGSPVSSRHLRLSGNGPIKWVTTE